MKISYNWLKWYIPNAPEPEKLVDVFTYHLCEVESVETVGQGDKLDTIFDISILPNRAHDLLSHQGIARELASLLSIDFVDPTSKYKVPESVSANLNIDVQSDKCRRYMGRVVRNVDVVSSPEWIKEHLESIGQRSINSIVDSANIVMYDSGQPIHCFDLDKVTGTIVVREAKEGEQMTTLDGKELKLKTTDMVIADEKNILALAGVKGGKVAEVDAHTKNIIIEVANFDPVSVRKSARGFGIFTDAAKRFENDLPVELCSFGMLEMSALIAENNPTAIFEYSVDIFTNQSTEKKITFKLEKISKILGLEVSADQMEEILKRYNFTFSKIEEGSYEIVVPPMRPDLQIVEDVSEEVGRILGYDKIVPKIRDLSGFGRHVNGPYSKIVWARNQLILNGYSEVMTYSFRDKGEIEVLYSAMDKKFLRSNISDGLKESINLNQTNSLLLTNPNVKLFQIGAVFLKDKEEIRVAYGDVKKINELGIDEFCELFSPKLDLESMNLSLLANMALQNKLKQSSPKFKKWSVFPFISRDVALWVPEGVLSGDIKDVIEGVMGDLVVMGPVLFDEFKKDDKVSYAFRLVFQSHEKTLTDEEVGVVMDKITQKLKENKDWQVR